MDRTEILETAFERGYFTAADAEALGGMAGVHKVDWDAKIEDGFPRLEIDVTKDDAEALISEAQEIGLWAEVIEGYKKMVRLKFTIPPVD